jgi:hypothetical protein
MKAKLSPTLLVTNTTCRITKITIETTIRTTGTNSTLTEIDYSTVLIRTDIISSSRNIYLMIRRRVRLRYRRNYLKRYLGSQG